MALCSIQRKYTENKKKKKGAGGIEGQNERKRNETKRNEVKTEGRDKCEARQLDDRVIRLSKKYRSYLHKKRLAMTITLIISSLKLEA